MKKLLYLFLTVLIVACSSSDDDSNGGVTLNAQFVGSWLTEYDNEGEVESLIIEFNANGTGNFIENYEGETYTESFAWSTTSTLLTIYSESESGVDSETVEYNFITNDQVRIIDSDGETIILNRIALNAQFVGSWLTEFDDEEGGSLLLEFNADGTGSENFVLDGETETEVFFWSTTSTLMTVTYAPNEVAQLMYEFLTDDQVRFFEDEDETFEVIFDRVID